MAYYIDIPDSANSVSNISMGKELFEMRVSFNSRSEGWYMSLLDKDGFFVIKGLKILPNTPLLRRNRDLFPEGSNLYVVRVLEGNEVESNTLGRDNLGSGRSYELLYFHDSER